MLSALRRSFLDASIASSHGYNALLLWNWPAGNVQDVARFALTTVLLLRLLWFGRDINLLSVAMMPVWPVLLQRRSSLVLPSGTAAEVQTGISLAFVGLEEAEKGTYMR